MLGAVRAVPSPVRLLCKQQPGEAALTTDFAIVAPRLCRIRGGAEDDYSSFPLDDDGFLEPEAVTNVQHLVPGALVPARGLAEVGAFVLLGEPGLGKTTFFSDVLTPEAVGQVERIDGATLDHSTFEDLLGRHLEDVPAADGGRLPQLTVVLDQADESPIITTLARILRQRLAGLHSRNVRFLVACRTADYPGALTKQLTDLCGTCVLADLAPLTRTEAVRLCDSIQGVDGASVVDAATAAGAGALASVPLTLNLLARTFVRTGSLDETPAQLFALGIRQLLDEPALERAEPFATTSDQRLAAAGRIAARSILAGRRSIWTGRALDVAGHDVRDDSFVGGQEVAIAAEFEITMDVVRETLACALFTGRGDNRLSFRHSSMSAYLAATYINARDLPQAQLESLFLVAAPDASRSIPINLRETAAWLVTLDDRHATWLVRADPESLVGHSQLVDSPQVRELIVASLLDRAGEIELSYRPWLRAKRRLDHPNLSQQLLEVLQEATAGEPENWEQRSRITLAIRLAREARTAGLSAPLLQIVQNDGWSPHLRALAARTIAEIDLQAGAEPLREVLFRYEDPDDPLHNPDTDADEELLGALLECLYPEHLSTADALMFVHARRRRNLIGSYLSFLHELPSLIPEADLADALTWMAGRRLVAEGIESTATDQSEMSEAVVGDPAQGLQALDIDEEVVAGLLDRASISATAPTLMRTVAAILDKQVRAYASPPLPLGMALCDADEVLNREAVELSRLAALEFARLIADRAGQAETPDVYNVLHGWGSADSWTRDRLVPASTSVSTRTALLGTADIEWLYEQVAAADAADEQDLADVLAQMVPYLMDFSNEELLSFVFERRDLHASAHVRYWFDPIPLDSDYAIRQRQLLERQQQRQRQRDEGDASRDVKAAVAGWRAALARATRGDPNAFWPLVWNLQQDPATGAGRAFQTDDLREFPGTVAMGDEAEAELVIAAEQYLRAENDHRDEWLGSNRWDRRAFAGYLALALLARTEGLSRVPADVWVDWIGACLWFPLNTPESGEAHALRTTLLESCVETATEETCSALLTVVRGELARGQALYELEDVPFRRHPRLLSIGLRLMVEFIEAWEETPFDGPKVASDTDEKVEAPDNVAFPNTEEAKGQVLFGWDRLVATLASSDQALVTQAVDELWSTVTDRTRLLAARATGILVRANPAAWERFILGELGPASEDAGLRELVLDVAQHRRENVPLDELSEEHLVASYLLLRAMFPPELDEIHEDVHFVSAEEDAWHLRDDFLNALAERATAEALAGLLSLSSTHPNDLRVTSALLQGRRSIFANAWVPPEPEWLAGLFADTGRRLVRSESELAALLTQVLADVEHDARSHGELLWDRIRKRADDDAEDLWLPKTEAAFAAYVAHELLLRLHGRGLAVNREILVRPTDPYGAGDRTDILVEATVRDDPIVGFVPTRLAVVLELKGCWNRTLLADQRAQLADRYLEEASTAHGIYLVAWFPVDEWTASDYRREHVAALNASEVEARLASQAWEVGLESNLRVQPMHITFHRPTRLPSAKKAPAKKTPAKKTPAKKTPAKKTPAKKTPG
jgi:hypothetical protein